MEKKKKTVRKRKTANKYRPPLQIPGIPSETLEDQRIMALLPDLIAGVKDGTIQSLEEFRFLNLIPYRTWKDWCIKSPYMKAINDMAKEGIYRQRINAAMEKKCDSRMITDLQLSNYSAEYKDHVEWSNTVTNKQIQELMSNQAHTGNNTLILNLDGESIQIGGPKEIETTKESSD